MCFTGICSGCGQHAGLAYHQGYHLCAACTPAPVATEADLEWLERWRAEREAEL